MVDAVQHRDHDRAADSLGRCELERRLELGRLRRHPEDVDIAVELRRGGDVHGEVAEDGALDHEPPAVALERRRPQEQDDVVPGPRQRGADETADPTGAEDRVAHGVRSYGPYRFTPRPSSF